MCDATIDADDGSPRKSCSQTTCSSTCFCVFAPNLPEHSTAGATCGCIKAARTLSLVYWTALVRTTFDCAPRFQTLFCPERRIAHCCCWAAYTPLQTDAFKELNFLDQAAKRASTSSLSLGSVVNQLLSVYFMLVDKPLTCWLNLSYEYPCCRKDNKSKTTSSPWTPEE